MTQIQFNLNIEDLKESIMNSDLNAVVKASIVLVLNTVMEKERDDYLQAGAYQRTSDRRDYRNGYYERDLLLSIGKITLKVPRTRNGEFAPSVFERYARCDQAFVLSMLEMFVNGGIYPEGKKYCSTIMWGKCFKIFCLFSNRKA